MRYERYLLHGRQRCPAGRHGPGGAVMGPGRAADLPADRPAWPELIAALDWLPLASLVLAADGTALAASQGWAALSGVAAEDSRADGWLGAVETLEREVLRARLRDAAGAGQPGHADFRLAGRRCRWWWRPGPSGYLIVCVADLGDFPSGYDQHQSGRRPPARLVRRSEFVNMAGRALRRSGHHGEHVAVVAVLFKEIADQDHGDPGGLAGDLARAAEERVSAAAGPAGVAAQVGTGEFVILLDGLRSPPDAGIIASQVRDAVSQPLDARGTRVPVTAATGFAVTDGPGYSAEELIREASRAARSGSRPGRAEPPAPPAAFPPGPAWADMADLLVHRLFGVGLAVQSASALADGPVTARLQQALDELDSIIRDTRTAALESLAPPESHDSEGQ